MEQPIEIMEKREEWLAEYESGWKAIYLQTGDTDFSKYKRVRNKQVPAVPGVDLSKSRLLLISTAGGYLKDEQEPFDAPNQLGDYTTRIYPASTPLDRIAFAHDHYDHAMIDADPQVGVPLRHLEELVAEGVIGEMAPSVVSFMGYQPDATRVVDQIFPVVLEQARLQKVDAALLIPL